MPATREQQTTFWRMTADGLNGGLSVVDTLAKAAEAQGGSPLADAAAALIAEIRNGARWSEAMEKQPDVFSRAMCRMVRAGEAGGVLDVIAGRITKALEDGSFAPPGVDSDPDTEQERYWRALGWMIISGVPILPAFSIIGEEIATGKLAEATGAIHRRILDGGTIAEAIREFPEVFADEVCRAIAAGEEQGDLDERIFQTADALKTGDLTHLAPCEEPVESTENAAPVVREVHRILLDAMNLRASDIHLDPLESGQLRVRVRADGVLCDIDPVFVKHAQAVTNRIKIMAGVDVAERQTPQDGRIIVEIKGRKLEFYVSLIPTMFGERLCLRMFSSAVKPLRLEQLGLSEADLATVTRLANLPSGMVLVNGPVGCGKTTLLYAMLRAMDRDHLCVITIEDPIEGVLEGVAQIPVQPRHGLTIARALRSALRQAPNVLMVAESRDLETAQMCAQAALTGHLVLASLHSSDGLSAVRRMLDLGLEPFVINAALTAVVSTRLVRQVCPQCKAPATLRLHSMPPAVAEFVQAHPDTVFVDGKGCEACNGTGYQGRMMLCEILEMTDRLREALQDKSDLSVLRDVAAASGTKSLLSDGIEKAAQGLTSLAEACRVASH